MDRIVRTARQAPHAIDPTERLDVRRPREERVPGEGVAARRHRAVLRARHLGDERAPAHCGHDEARALEILVRADHGVAMDLELTGERARRRKPESGRQRARRDARDDLIEDLTAERVVRAGIERESERRCHVVRHGPTVPREFGTVQGPRVPSTPVHWCQLHTIVGSNPFQRHEWVRLVRRVAPIGFESWFAVSRPSPSSQRAPAARATNRTRRPTHARSTAARFRTRARPRCRGSCTFSSPWTARPWKVPPSSRGARRLPRGRGQTAPRRSSWISRWKATSTSSLPIRKRARAATRCPGRGSTP